MTLSVDNENKVIEAIPGAFEIENDQVKFLPEALMLEPFRKLWKRDKAKGKPVAYAELDTV